MSMKTDIPDDASKLRGIVEAFRNTGFAVVDGAQFEDLPATFRTEGLFARSLFLEHAAKNVEAAGPWLIGLDQSPNVLDRVFALVGDLPAVVFWNCGGGEALLYRHLRTLNLALIPRWAVDGFTAPPPDGSGLEPAPVMFRHWDPRVLGGLMPVLHPAQFARMLGPAGEIAFLSEDFGGVRRAMADPALPSAPRGMLAIRSEQIEILSKRRLAASHRRIASYLREVAAEDMGDASDEAVLRHVAISVAAGRRLKLSSEAAHCRWAYLMLATRGKIAGSPEVARYISQGGADPDEQVSLVLKSTIIALRRQRARLDAGR